MFEDFIKMKNKNFNLPFLIFSLRILILNLTPAVKITSVLSEISWSLAPPTLH